MAVALHIEESLAGWMRELSHWRDLAGVFGAGLDAAIEGLYDGLLGAMPGQQPGAPALFPSIEALPMIGKDRRILRGPAETAPVYAERLRAWLDLHRQAGSAFGLLEQLQSIFSPDAPRVRLVTNGGVWYTLDPDGARKLHTPTGAGGFTMAPDGSTTPLLTPAHPWDWDGLALPFRIWGIIYAPAGAVIPGTEGVYGDGTTWWGESGGTWGTRATAQHVGLVRQLFAGWKPGGMDNPWIIIAFDPASFDPETPGPYPAAGMPDGLWGVPWKDSGGVYVKSRNETARYWKGATA